VSIASLSEYSDRERERERERATANTYTLGCLGLAARVELRRNAKVGCDDHGKW